MFSDLWAVPKTIKVLHVDDEESFLEVASHFMQKVGGLDVHGATSVRSATDMMSRTSFDVIVSDYQMPETDGIDFLKMVRARGSDIPFILFTGKGREDVVIEALNQGADFYLQKGGDLRSQFHELTSMISKAVESRRSTSDLVDSQERFRELADSISDLLVGLDDDFRVTFWNKAAEEVLGVKSAEAIGMPVLDLVPAMKGTPVEDALRSAAGSRAMQSATTDVLSEDGERTFGVNVYPGVEGLLVFVRDITEAETANRLLTESEERYRALVDASPTAILLFVTDTILYANPAAVKLYDGDDESDLVGKKVFELMLPEFIDETAARIRKIYEGSVTVPTMSLKARTKTGRVIDIEINSIPVTFSGRRSILTMIRDITEEKHAEALLRAHQEELRTIIDSVPAMISFQCTEGRFLRVNRSFVEATGLDEDHLRGRRVEDVLPAFGEMFSPQDKKVVETRKPLIGAVIPYQAKLGVRWARTDKIPYVNDDGEVVGVLTVAEDITDRLDFERRLARLQVMLDNIDDAVIFVDSNFIIESWNRAAEEMYGFSAEEVIGKNGRHVLETDSLQNDPDEMRSRLTEGATVSAVFRQKRKDGEWIFAECTAVCLKDDEGRTIGFGSINRDISERMKAGDVLRESEEAFRALAENSPFAVIIGDGKGGQLYANRKLAELTGYSVDELLKLNAFEKLTRPEDRGIFEGKMRKRLEDGSPAEAPYERIILRKDGTEVMVEMTPTITMWKGEKRPMALIQDITERKKAEDVVRRVKEQMEYLLSESSSVTYSCSAEDPYGATFVSPNVGKLYGFEPEDFTKDPGFWASRIHPDDSGRVLRGLLAVFERESHVHEYRWKRKDGTYVWIHDDVRLVKNEDGAPVEMIGHWSDVTDRKKAEAEREEKQRDFSFILDSAPILAFFKDKDGKFLRVNKAFAVIFGKPEGYFVGKTLFDILPRDIAQVMTDDDQWVLSSGCPKLGIIESYGSSKDERWVQTEKVPIKDEAGDTIGVAGFAQDISERKKAEEGLRKVNKKLNLLGSVTRHDSLNQLTILKGWLATAVEREGDDSVRDMLLKAENAADSLKMHLDFTSRYKNLGMKRPTWVPLAEAAAKVTEGLGRQGISVNIEVEDIEVFADPMLENVFRNLVNNSIAHGGGDMDRISLSLEEGKDGLVIIYEDNGVGIPTDEKPKIFAAGHGKRHGYGLYLSWEVLSITDITLKETGIPEKGARFEISVPPGNYRRQSEAPVTP